MTTLANPWLPEFKEHVFGIGLISLNYNLFESTLQYIMWRYTSIETTNFFFAKWSNEDRTAAIRHFAGQSEKEPEVLDRIDHLMTYYAICAENRNILMHSRQSLVEETPGPGFLSIEKRLKDRTGGKNVFHLDIDEIRQVSNEIVDGIVFCLDIDTYLRDRNSLNRLMSGVAQVPALPSKPPLPHKLDPHRPVVNLQAGVGPPESSREKS